MNYMGVDIFGPFIEAANVLERQRATTPRNLCYIHANINNSLEILLQVVILSWWITRNVYIYIYIYIHICFDTACTRTYTLCACHCLARHDSFVAIWMHSWENIDISIESSTMKSLSLRLSRDKHLYIYIYIYIYVYSLCPYISMEAYNPIVFASMYCWKPPKSNALIFQWIYIIKLRPWKYWNDKKPKKDWITFAPR
jgi:hypothetical protein